MQIFETNSNQKLKIEQGKCVLNVEKLMKSVSWKNKLNCGRTQIRFEVFAGDERTTLE